MDETMRLFWETYSEFYSNELMIHKNLNFLRDFEDDFIDGPILELGSGQSSFLVEFSKTGREIFAIDNDDFQLDKLKERIESYAGKSAGKIHLLNITIPEKELPDKKFSLVIASNFLHFFSINECEKIIKQIISRTQKGSLVYVIVHSQLHSYNDPTDAGIKAYFKHFFSENDLTNLFNEEYFERVLFLDMQQSKKSKYDKEMEIKWVEKILDSNGIFDIQKRQELIEQNTKDENVGSLVCIYRRK